MANKSDASPEIWKISMIKGKEKRENLNSLIQPNSAFIIYTSYPAQFLSFLFVVTGWLPMDYIDTIQRKHVLSGLIHRVVEGESPKYPPSKELP